MINNFHLIYKTLFEKHRNNTKVVRLNEKREMLSFLTISFCYKGCTFLSFNKIMCINQKSHQYLRFLFILKNKSFSSHTKVVAINSKSNILGDFLYSKQYIVSPIMCYTTLGSAL